MLKNKRLSKTIITALIVCLAASYTVGAEETKISSSEPELSADDLMYGTYEAETPE